jgi:hypothetical protein
VRSPCFGPVGLLVAIATACGGPLPSSDTPTILASATATPDAGAAADAARSEGLAYHTITITLCAKDAEGCSHAQGAGAGAGYRVAFGSSAGTLRSRDQAQADLYRELRDRTAIGTHLAAKEHRRQVAAEAGSGPALASARASQSAADSTESTGADELVEAARQLVDAVDKEGEVTLDVAHGRATCKISLTTTAADTPRCLVRQESRGNGREPETPRRSDDNFGKSGAPGH